MVDISLLRCVKCLSDKTLKIKAEDMLFCTACKYEYPLINNRPIILDRTFSGFEQLVDSAKQLPYRNLVERKKIWNPKINPYKFYFKELFPKCNSNDPHWDFLGKNVSKMVLLINKYSNKETCVLDVGAGDARYGAFFSNNNYISTDLVFSSERHSFEYVDIVSDVEHLAIASNSADYVLNFALMEHIPRPEKVVHEMARVLKSGGQMFSIIPLTRPEHMQPFDFYRYTQFSIKKLFSEHNLEVKYIKGSNNALWTPIHYLNMACLSFPFENFRNRFIAILVNRLFFILLYPLVLIGKKFDKYFPDTFPIYYWVECKKK